MVEENDWRLEVCGDETCITNAKFQKIKFPDFWAKSCESKNAFYHKVIDDAEAYVNEFHRYEDYLKDDRVQLFWHEHCFFCFEKFMTDMDVECYCTTDFEHWICEECFNDFKNKFDFSVIDEK